MSFTSITTSESCKHTVKCFLVMYGAIAAYCCFPKKPYINVERTLDTQLSSFGIRRTHVNISGDTTAAFVFNTFNEWFANTTIATIKKTLRTTNGRHKIEIDEKVLAKYLQNGFLESETNTEEPLVTKLQIYCCVHALKMFNTIEQTVFIEQKRHFGRIKVKKTLLKRYILKKNTYIESFFGWEMINFAYVSFILLVLYQK